MAKKIESFMYPEKIYLAEVDGGYQFFKEDPLDAPDREAVRIDIGAVLNNFLGGGHCSVGNPIVLKIRAGRLDRCRPFTATAPQNIRRGTLVGHFEDYDGNIVEILPGTTGISEFPFVGAVIKKDGTPLAFRNYSAHGQCMDESPDHEIFLIDGALSVGAPKDEAEEGADEKPAEETSGDTPAPEPGAEQNRRPGRRAGRARKEQQADAELPLGRPADPEDDEENY